MRPFRSVFVVASLALVLVPSGAVGQPPVSGTLAYQLCGKDFTIGVYTLCRGWIEAWDLGRAQARPLTPPPGPGEKREDDGPAWSPDGRLLAFVRVSPRKSGVYVIRANGTGLRRIVALNFLNALEAGGQGLRWSPDGTRLAFDRYG